MTKLNNLEFNIFIKFLTFSIRENPYSTVMLLSPKKVEYQNKYILYYFIITISINIEYEVFNLIVN